MVKTVNIHEAKTQLSRLLAEVQKAGEFIIAKGGKPIACLTAEAPPPRQPGRYRDRGLWNERFFEPLPEDELSAWEDG